jgi:hypothetical protein
VQSLLLWRERPSWRATSAVTPTSEPAPELTRREREVLYQLCRTVVAGEAFTEPASQREIAQRW